MNKRKEFYIGELVVINPNSPRKDQLPALIIGKIRPDFINIDENPYYKIQVCGDDTPDERWIPSSLIKKMGLAR